MGPSVIFVYGDLEMARQVVQGMNAIFNSPGWYSHQGAQYNAGGFFSFGVMLVIWASVLSWFIHQRFNLGPVLLAFLVYVVMTVPRTNLWIEDIYTGGVVVVGDTPVGIAVLASLGSTLTKRMADAYDTQFSPITAGASTMYQSGFVSPLRMMLALRKVVPRGGSVYMSANLARYMATCVERSYNPLPGATTLDDAAGKVAWLLDHPRPNTGPVLYQTVNNPDGVGLSCDDAATNIKAQMDDYLNDTGDLFSQDFNASIVAATGQNYVFNSNYDITTLQNGVQDVLGATPAEARAFMQDLLFHKLSMASMECGVATNTYEFRECITSIMDAAESAKTDTTIKASIFQKVMIPMMNILTYLFFGLAPIVIVLSVAMGIQGIGILMKFALFGFWVQSWVPTAIFINYIIFEQTRNELKNFYYAFQNGAYNPSHFFDVVSTKLMVASDLLSATPLITLAIMGGGAMAMSSMASSSGRAASAKSDSSNASPKLRKTDPLYTYSGNTLSNAGRNPRAYRPGVSSIADPNAPIKAFLGSGTYRKALNNQVSAANAKVQGLSRKYTGAVQTLGSRVASQGIGASYTTTGGGTRTITGQDMRSVQSAILDRVGGSTRLSDQKKADLTSYFQGVASLNAQLPKGKAGDKARQKLKDQMKNNLMSEKSGLHLSAKEAADITHDWIEASSKEGSVDQQRLRSGSLTLSDAAQLTRAAATSENASFVAEARDVETYSDQLEQARSEQQRLEKSASTLQAFDRATGGDYAPIIYSGWQQGQPVQTQWNPDRFRGLTHAARQQGFLDEQQENTLNGNFSQQYDRNLDQIRRQDPLLSPSQAESLAGFKTWLDFGANGSSVRFSNLLNQERGAMLNDYVGPGMGPDDAFFKSHGDRMAEGEKIHGPDQSGKPAHLLKNRGKGPDTRYAAGQKSANDAMGRLSSPQAAFGAATTKAANRYRDGAGAASGQYENSGHHRKFNARNNAFNAQWENSFFARTVEKAASMSDEMQELITQAKTSGSSAGYAWDQLGAKFHKRLANHQAEVITGLEKRLKEVNAQIPNASTEPTLFGFGDSEKTDLIQEKASLEQEIADAKAFRTELLNTGGDRFSPSEVLQLNYHHEAQLMGLSGLGAKKYVEARTAAFGNGNMPWTDQEKTLQKLKPRMKDFQGPDANVQHSDALRGWMMAYRVSMERNGTPGISPWQDYDHINEVMSHGPEPLGAKRDHPQETDNRPPSEGWVLNPLSKPNTPNR